MAKSATVAARSATVADFAVGVEVAGCVGCTVQDVQFGLEIKFRIWGLV